MGQKVEIQTDEGVFKVDPKILAINLKYAKIAAAAYGVRPGQRDNGQIRIRSGLMSFEKYHTLKAIRDEYNT